MSLKTALISVLFVSLLFSQTYLSGEISGLYPGYDYVVQGTIHILPGKRAEFAPGSRFFFDQFSGIVVHGNLICKGNKDNLIIFSSINDESFLIKGVKPDPFDWNGIEVKSTSDTVILSHTKISYSSLGIVVESKSTNVKLQATQFFLNGTNNFSIAGKVILFADNVNIDYPTQSDFPILVQQDTISHSPTRLSRKKEKGNVPRIIYSLSTGILAMCGTALWIGAGAKAHSYHDNYETQTTLLEVERYRKKRDTWVTYRNIGAILCFAGSVTFPINFAINKKRGKSNVSNK